MNIEDIKKVLAEAPKSDAAYIDGAGRFLDASMCLIGVGSGGFTLRSDAFPMRNVGDLRNIVELTERAEKAEKSVADRDSWRRVAERLEQEKINAIEIAEKAKRERDESVLALAAFLETSPDECMCGSKLRCYSGGCVSTFEYLGKPQAVKVVNKFALQQKIEALNIHTEQCGYYKCTEVVRREIEQLRAQLEDE